MRSKISGWGRALFAYTTLSNFQSFQNIVFSNPERGIIARGLGRSYGDCSVNSGGITLECLNPKVIEIDSHTGVATVSSGITILELEQQALPLGYFPFVVPGTAYVTIGGAIASDIHGKSHHRVGSFSKYVLEIRVLTADGNEITARPEGENEDLFWATVGGMGLTGIILEAKIRLLRIETAYVSVDESRAKNLQSLISTLLSFNEKYFYTVAWVDFSGKFEGRGVISGANHVNISELNRRQKNRFLQPLVRKKVSFPGFLRVSLINNFTISIFNKIWFHKPVGRKVQHIEKFMHPLDTINNWNVVYGKKGFLQYQFVIPFNNVQVLTQILEQLKKTRTSSFLSVLKTFSDESRGMLSFPREGWTLSFDLPIGDPGLSKLLVELDILVLEAGGRIYLTKDSRMNSSVMPIMYKNIIEWKKIKSEFDPENLWQSDLGRRLGLC